MIKPDIFIKRSILSNVVNYYSMIGTLQIFMNEMLRHQNKNNHRKIFDRLKEGDRQILDLDFGNTPDKLSNEYLDMYGVQSEVINTTRFHENSDLSMTYLGRRDITRASKIKAEEKFAISEQGYTVGKLLDSTECTNN